MKRKHCLIVMLLTILGSINFTFGQWEQIKMPGVPSGSIYSICFKDSLMFVGKSGGVFVSEDDGKNWIKVNPDLPPREYSAIAMSIAVSGQSVIAAFNEPGVYLSVNDGKSWTKTSIEGSLRSTPQILAADGQWIIAGNFHPSGTNYQSTDNGASWSEISSFSQVISAALQDSLALIITNYSIFLSTDHGATWNNVHSSETYSGFSSAVAFAGTYAYAGVSGLNNAYILSSTDRGLTWRQDSVFINCTSINAIVSSPDLSINNSVFAGTDSGVFRSANNGLSWLPANNGLTSSAIMSLAFKESGNGGTPVLYAGTGDGIFRSSNFGDTWVPVGSPAEWVFASNGSDLFAAASNSTYSSLGWKAFRSENIYLSTVYHSTDDGQNWIEKYKGFLDNDALITSLNIKPDQNNNNILIAGGKYYDFNSSTPGHAYSIILTSDDNGANWEKNYDDQQIDITAIGVNTSGIFLGAYDNDEWNYFMLRSTDNGETWSSLAPEIPVSYIKSFNFDGEKIYAGGSYQEIIAIPRPPIIININSIITSNDNGSIWTKVQSVLDSGVVISSNTGDTISTISSIFADGSHLLAGMHAYYFYETPASKPFANGGGLYHLMNDGTNWILADSAFTGRSVFGFEKNGDNIFTATEKGVYHSNNYGSNWYDISSGMNNIYVSSLFKTDSYLYASTINGIWKRPLSEITSVENDNPDAVVPAQFSLSQNYPNPFNPVTVISYTIGTGQLSPVGTRSRQVGMFVQLKIYDVLGREVATLVNEEKPAGTYKVRFDAGNLSTGVYIYKLSAGSFTSTKKLMLIK